MTAASVSGLPAATMTARPAAAAAVRLGAGPAAARTPLQRALDALVSMPSGPPGVIVIVQHGGGRTVYQAGTASLVRPRPLASTDHERLASFSKAFNGAVALSLVSQGKLRLGDTIGQWLPALPRAWHRVTLRDMLQHRSGLPDYTASQALARQLQRAPHQFIAPGPGVPAGRARPDQPATRFPPPASLPARVCAAAGSPSRGRERGGLRVGGLVSTPADTNRFIRAYLAPRFFSRATQAAQLRFVPGSSQPAGPGVNASGLGVFRYRTRCGTIYGHTGNFLGYTQLAAASRGGANSVAVTATEQLTRKAHPRVLAALRHAELLAVCAAMAPR
jgi:D-alanyl-D-alanine carboxypeptidase